jgi:hypothetical protein
MAKYKYTINEVHLNADIKKGRNHIATVWAGDGWKTSEEALALVKRNAEIMTKALNEAK